MKRIALALACAASLAACSTADVQRTCAETQHVLEVGRPFLAFGPPEVQMAVMLIGAGTYACGTSEYAAARERVIAWLRTKGARI